MISCFNIQEAGGEEERGIDQSSVVKVSERGREAGGMKEDRAGDGGEGEMKEGKGWREGLNEHASYGTECVCVYVCFLRFPLIELVLLNVQRSAFRLMVELIFLTLLGFLCVYVHLFA